MVEEPAVSQPDIGERTAERVPMPGDHRGRIETQSDKLTLDEFANPFGNHGAQWLVQLGAVVSRCR